MTPPPKLPKAGKAGALPQGGVMSRPLDPDLNWWDQQPDEGDPAYASFLTYRDAEERNAKAMGGSSKRWSAIWSWKFRCRAWDRHLAQGVLDDLVRYRVRMNDRLRKDSVKVQVKIIEYLEGLDLTTLKPHEAARLWWYAVKIEREAAGANLAAEGELPEQQAPPQGEASLGTVFSISEGFEADLAQFIAKSMPVTGEGRTE